MADFNTLPDSEPDDFNEQLGDITPKTGFGEARFIVTRNGKVVDVKIKASDALVRSVAREHFEGEEPTPRTAMRLDYEAGTLSILACCRFGGHRDKVFSLNGEHQCSEGSSPASSSLRR